MASSCVIQSQCTLRWREDIASKTSGQLPILCCRQEWQGIHGIFGQPCERSASFNGIETFTCMSWCFVLSPTIVSPIKWPHPYECMQHSSTGRMNASKSFLSHCHDWFYPFRFKDKQTYRQAHQHGLGPHLNPSPKSINVLVYLL